MLPYDVIRKISLYLPSWHVAVCREYYNMYNEGWYREYLEILYPNMILYTPTTYKNLYIKSLEQGVINVYDTYVIPLKISGVKSAMCSSETHMVLTFNGDLFVEDTLLDTQVIDIATWTYIKECDWYVYYNEKWHRIDVNAKFMATECDIISNKIAYAMTSTGVYCYDIFHKSVKFVPINTPVAIMCDINCYVKDKHGRVYSIIYDNDYHLIPLDERITMTNGGMLTDYDNYYYQYIHDNNPSTFKTIPYDTHIKKFMAIGCYLNKLTRDHIFRFTADEHLTYNNVKSIGGHRWHSYFIQ